MDNLNFTINTYILRLVADKRSTSKTVCNLLGTTPYVILITDTYNATFSSDNSLHKTPFSLSNQFTLTAR